MNNNANIVGIEDAKLIYMNFSGAPSMYNPEGDRNFNINLTEAQAKKLEKAGYNVKTKKVHDEEQNQIKVKVNFKFRPPQIHSFQGKKHKLLDEKTVGDLDFADIEKVDLTLRPYNWSRPDGSHGVTAYLNSMYVTIAEDEFAAKYADFDEDEDEQKLPF